MKKLKQKKVSLVKDLLWRLSRPVEVVTDFCAGTRSTAKRVCRLISTELLWSVI